MITSLTIYASL